MQIKLIKEDQKGTSFTPAQMSARHPWRVLSSMLLLCACISAPLTYAHPLTAQENAQWFKLPTEVYKGKQDDIFFIDPQTGFYGNGAGKIFKTTDGGQHWALVLNKPGTYVRALGFVDAQLGFAGNIGTEYFPGVTDTTPLYRTVDGGANWAPVTGMSGPEVKGLCAIDILKTSFINAGVLEHRTMVHAGGRVGGPAYLMRSLDGGSTWKSIDMNAHLASITDVKFFDEMNGMVVGGDDADIERSHAVVVSTRDGGETWQRAFTSSRMFELAWKVAFPSRNVGYVTVQDYNPDKTVTQRVVGKSVDGGKSWQEIPLADDFAVNEFGVGFADELTGWVGTSTSGFATTDGGKSWQRVNMGRAINKIRIVPDGEHYVGYAIGVEVFKFGTPPEGTHP
ncbi:WD40/YVTN/BNR-like repeat-containing protein [Solimicrobium silvestre]|uniref:Photosynthesis system II assembly factor Ycf48/Hcf136-like domain-containing protein n=1 Tax=Solimicrobium silvestre TaxID=2099400 RepID=A0A2S9GYJ8_9BURK|nr:hypothetical protein [Solimicrobium silvestre]PRC92783.1 hypothetical protein S2091_2513 [Solimicrobium silvestre]